MLTALIVDDEPLAREELRLLLEQAGNIRLLGECAHAMEALPAIHRLKPDLLFLDIQMPRINGLELVSMLDPDLRPHIVFITAYDEFALRAFEENALDYLLKPVTAERMNKALERIQRLLSPKGELAGQPAAGSDPHRPAPAQHPLQRPQPHPAAAPWRGGVRPQRSGWQQGGERPAAGHPELTLRTLEEKTGFVRCHRQYLLNPGQIREILLLDGGLAEVVTQGGHKVPVSRRYLSPSRSCWRSPEERATLPAPALPVTTHPLAEPAGSSLKPLGAAFPPLAGGPLPLTFSALPFPCRLRRVQPEPGQIGRRKKETPSCNTQSPSSLRPSASSPSPIASTACSLCARC